MAHTARSEVHIPFDVDWRQKYCLSKKIDHSHISRFVILLYNFDLKTEKSPKCERLTIQFELKIAGYIRD